MLFEPNLRIGDQQRLQASMMTHDLYLTGVVDHLRQEMAGNFSVSQPVRRRTAAEVAAENPSNSRAPTLPSRLQSRARPPPVTIKTAPRKSSPGNPVPVPVPRSACDSDNSSDSDAPDHAFPAIVATISSPRELIFDSGATAHLMHTSLLPAFSNMRYLDKPRVFSGISLSLIHI